MKKQILVVFTGAMEIGGIERSLISLFDVIDYDSYDVDLFLYAHHGALFSQINKQVNLLPEVKELAYLRESFTAKLKNGCFYSAGIRLMDQVRSIYSTVDFDSSWKKVLMNCTPRLDKKYDLAIGFFLPFDFILDKVSAKKKIGWIHTDYSAEKVDLVRLRQKYEGLDKIVAVSEDCRDTFCRLFPDLQNRVIVIENVLSPEFIFREADHDVSDEMESDNSIKLLSVGRFCKAKNFDNVPFICKEIRKRGINAKWYLIGFGSDEQLIREKVKEAGMGEWVVILGKKDNPYPYIKACDFYIQPSRYEGKCVAVREAQILHKPVIITDYATSRSQLEDGVDGIIVPMDSESCAMAIADVISNLALRRKLIENTKLIDYSNVNEISKLYRLMDE